jgi:hypothetical protein
MRTVLCAIALMIAGVLAAPVASAADARTAVCGCAHTGNFSACMQSHGFTMTPEQARRQFGPASQACGVSSRQNMPAARQSNMSEVASTGDQCLKSRLCELHFVKPSDWTECMKRPQVVAGNRHFAPYPQSTASTRSQCGQQNVDAGKFCPKAHFCADHFPKMASWRVCIVLPQAANGQRYPSFPASSATQNARTQCG